MSVLIFAAMIIIPALVLALPPFRRPLVTVVTEVLLALRWMLAEAPLRAITGRRKPDYARIRRLEIECGLIDPPPPSPMEAGITAFGAAARASSVSIGAMLREEARAAEAARLRAVRGELGKMASALGAEREAAREAASAARFTSRLIAELERDIAASFRVPPHHLRRSIILPPEGCHLEVPWRPGEKFTQLPPMDPPP